MLKGDEKKQATKPVSLKVMAELLDLSPATISIVLNGAPAAKSIAPATRARIFALAKKLDYQPNAIARSLRLRQTLTVGVIVPELSEGYFTMVMDGVEQCLMDAGYIYLVLCHRGRTDLIEEYPRLLVKRAVDGFLFVNTTISQPIKQPVVSISGHKKIPGVANILLDHTRSAGLALKHLRDLGHKRIVFMKGPEEVPDSDARWRSILETARSMNIPIHRELCVNIDSRSLSPEVGLTAIRDVLQRSRDFTAVFSFNDTLAIGAVRALADAGLSCPDRVSVVGFDDTAIAPFQVPRLTTVRQPLQKMGQTAAQLLLRRIQHPHEAYPETLIFEPELMVRESTSVVHASHPARRPRSPTRRQ